MTLDITQAAQARTNPSNWEVTSNAANGSATVASNRVTGEVFSGTRAAFDAIFSTSALPQLGADDVTLIQASVPCLLPGSGTVTVTTGALALTIAAQGIQVGPCWVYLPAAAFSDGVLGWYYCVMSANNAGIVYTNYQSPALPFVPYIPVDPVVKATGAGAYTGVVTEVTMLNVRVPANTIGINGKLKVKAIASHINGAINKVLNVKLGGTLIGTFTNTTTLFGAIEVALRNRGVANKQVISSEVLGVPLAAGYGTFDTTTDLALTITGTTTNVSESLTLEALEVSLD